MPEVRVLSWNIQLYGPLKALRYRNNVRLWQFIAATAELVNANVVVLMELMSSVSAGICFNIRQELYAQHQADWAHRSLPARNPSSLESYGIFWRRDQGFDADGDPALSTVDFPCNYYGADGRRAALAQFLVTGTPTRFVVSVYHAPPNNQAALGLERLAQTPELYQVVRNGAVAAVPHRILAGDYNQDVNTCADYMWLTQATPNPPPPAQLGEGAGTRNVTAARTSLYSWEDNPQRTPNPRDYRALQLDNIFSRPPHTQAPLNGPVDVVQQVMDPNSSLGRLARRFSQTSRDGQQWFRHANDIPQPFGTSLNQAQYAWLFVRYAISDHLPVFSTVTI